MARKHLPSVFFGGVEMNALTLRRALKLGEYRFDFDVGRHELAVFSDKGEIMRIQCAYESACKFVTEFGCKHTSEMCNTWAIKISEPVLHHDGSAGARAIERALVASGLPFKVVPKQRQSQLALEIQGLQYTLRNCTREQMIEMIKEHAQKYADVIALWKT